MIANQYVKTESGEETIVVQQVGPRTITRRMGAVKPESHLSHTLTPVRNSDGTPKMKPGALL